MDTKHCYSCKKTKPTSEFSKCRSRKDGLQPKCKECNKKDNKQFREEKPEYWSYENGYFSEKQKWQYISLYQAADKSIKIYMIKFDDGSKYIGSTKAHLNIRLSRHINDYKRFREGRISRNIPYLHKKFDEFKTYDDIALHLKNNTFIIDECSGSRTKQYTLESKWITKLEKQGEVLLNKMLPKILNNQTRGFR